jgi:hypothetical protein
MSRQLLSSLASALAPLVMIALAALAARLGQTILAHVRDRRVALALELAAWGAAAEVANLYQTLVKDLKNPASPGAWDASVGAAMKSRAIAELRRLYPEVVATLQAAGRRPDQIEALLGSLVERAVVDLKARTTTLPAQTNGSSGHPLFEDASARTASP